MWTVRTSVVVSLAAVPGLTAILFLLGSLAILVFGDQGRGDVDAAVGGIEVAAISGSSDGAGDEDDMIYLFVIAAIGMASPDRSRSGRPPDPASWP